MVLQTMMQCTINGGYRLDYISSVTFTIVFIAQLSIYIQLKVKFSNFLWHQTLNIGFFG